VTGALVGQAQLFQKTGRVEEAQKNYQEALKLYPTPFEGNSEALEMEIARTLDALGILQAGQEQWQNAERSFSRALELRRNLAEKRHAPLDSEAATTLLNRAKMRVSQNALKDAKADCVEAQAMLQPWWQSAPGQYGELMARVLCLLAGLAATTADPGIDACALAQQALAIAVDAGTRKKAAKLIQQLCAKPDSPSPPVSDPA